MITRKELVAKYKIALKKVNELKDKKYNYKTTRSCEPFGCVKNMTIEDVVKAGASIHDGDANITERIKQYGVLPEDLKNGEARKYLGYSIDDWDHDFTMRVEQVHDTNKLKTYETVVAKLVKNFTDEDRFLIEMGEIDALDVDLDDDSTAATPENTEGIEA